MKIVEVSALYPNHPEQTLKGWRQYFWQIVVRVKTDAGLEGYGYGGGGKAGVEIVNGHFRELLVGCSLGNTNDIHKMWDRLYSASTPYGRKGLAIMALSGVDLALWDLMGKAEAAPVYDLLGGKKKNQIKAYATGKDTDWYQELGFTAQKIPTRWTGKSTDIDDLVKTVSSIRSAIGNSGQIMIDTYMSWDTVTTVRMADHLREFNVYFVEDILTPDQINEQANLKSKLSPIKLAGGEHEFTHYGFRDIASSSALDIWQPDITWCGGLTAGKRIIEMAKSANVSVVPHRGGEVWGLHLIAATECDDFAELVMGNRIQPNDRSSNLWLDTPHPKDGHLTLSNKPGFGVHLNPIYT